ncbi:MAG: DUF2953 domain-containing protein [Tissierellales bacterium]
MKIALVALLILIIIFAIVPISIKIELNKKRVDDKISFKITVLRGLIKFYYEISYIDLVTKKNKLNNNCAESSSENASIKKKKSKKNGHLITVYYKIKKYIDLFIDIINYIIRKITINSLKWSSTVGFGDAALTGIAYGILWTIIGSLLNIIFNNKKINNVSVNLYPDFNNSILEIDFFCIIKFKIAHIIIAGIKGLKVLIKGGVLNG